MKVFAIIVCIVGISISTKVSSAPLGHCNFSKTKLAFSGTSYEQALCLLTPVKRYAHLGKPLKNLPRSLSKLMTGSAVPNRAQAKSYLSAKGLPEGGFGGPVAGPIAETNSGKKATYFVIHDTSSPYLRDNPFPQNIDTNEKINSFKGYNKRRAAHLFVNRSGHVQQYHDFDVPWRATKLENKVVGVSSRGRFIHIELIQPRRRDPNGGAKNDAIAPVPGFSKSQYARLAQLYVIASVRAESWLIPGYHTVIDSGLKDGHDDPQNFDLVAWDDAIAVVLKEMQ